MGKYEYCGYNFLTAKELDIAKRETESIEYIRAKTDFHNYEKLKKVYTMLGEKHAFVTPIGLNFMMELQQTLKTMSTQPVEGIPVVLPTEQLSKVQGRLTKDFEQVTNQRKQAKREIYEIKLRNSRIISFFLILIIIAMFCAVIFGKNSPLIDAESAIQDKYASWEQSLKERETVIKEKEAELLINSEEK